MRRGYAAFESGNIPEFKSLLAEDVEWEIPREFPYGGVFRGPDAVVELLATIPSYYASQHVEITDFDAFGDELVIVRGRHYGEVKNGTAYDVGFASFFTVRDGRVVRFREYVDPGKAIALLDSMRTEQ
ncbi:nuclear transport factor 2 family protein [Saccharopolyspora thermophila]|uniref:nuclear transport factor 2 family protein n=1 Tax=Saccharopolyspora thermophila TaxID=89367 RepID=UPI001663B202|nr:nuclear transport factor 2 family protein [Saccharopolyspora subtropica]